MSDSEESERDLQAFTSCPDNSDLTGTLRSTRWGWEWEVSNIPSKYSNLYFDHTFGWSPRRSWARKRLASKMREIERLYERSQAEVITEVVTLKDLQPREA